MKHLYLFYTLLFSAPLILTISACAEGFRPRATLRKWNRRHRRRTNHHVEELRRELELNHPSTPRRSRNAQEFSKRIDELSKEVLQNMIDRIIIVKVAEEKGLLLPESYIDQEYDEVIDRDLVATRPLSNIYVPVARPPATSAETSINAS